MAIKTKEDLLNSIKERFADDTTDETLSFIEDINDTMSDFETRVSDKTDWKNKYEENDKMWREKYRDRFFSANDNDNDNDDEHEEQKQKLTFEDLFTTKEGK